MACECDTDTQPQAPSSPTTPSSSSSSSSSPLPLSPKRSLFFHMDAAPLNPRSCGLAAVLVEAESRGRVLLGMRRPRALQLPPPPAIEFGVKNRDSRLALLSPVQRSPAARAAARSVAEEEYTCVIARGPNPRMIHIFDDAHAPPSLQHRDDNAFVGNQCSYQEVFFHEGIRDRADGEKLKA